MVRKYVILLCFFLGLIVGMAANELVVPVNTAPERPYYHGCGAGIRLP